MGSLGTFDTQIKLTIRMLTQYVLKRRGQTYYSIAKLLDIALY